ncbi:MAG: DUF4175 family protein [Bacteroidota bacterium]
MTPNNNYDLLIQKLDQFIRKFYLNQLIRGLLYTSGLVLLLFVLINLAEGNFYFERGVRKLLWYSFLGISLIAFGGWVVLPLARYLGLGSVISHDQAAGIIGRHFSNVQDKLLNVLQLRRQADEQGGAELVLASIDQKSAEISPVPFRRAIDLSQNRKYLKFALPPLLLLMGVILAAPGLISSSTNRLLKNNQDFERPAPFSFVLPQVDALQVAQYEDFPLTVEVEGEVLPNEVFIEIGGYTYRLQKEDAKTFSYQFSNVQADQTFKLNSGLVTSREYELDVLLKPSIADFEVKLDYPSYLGRPDEVLYNIGDLNVPAGTRIDWSFTTEHTDQLAVKFVGDAEAVELQRQGRDQYKFNKRAMRNGAYRLYVSNEDLPEPDSVGYALSVIPDLYPEIGVERFVDSLEENVLYFLGEAADDHGLKTINLVYRIKRGETGAEEEPVTILIAQPGSKQTRYEHVWDLNAELDLGPGDELTYYFEAYDNDGVNGSKSARTGVFAHQLPTEEEIAQLSEATEEEIKQELEAALEETRDLQEDVEEMQERLLQKEELDWQDRKDIERLSDRQEQVQERMQQAQQAFEENMERQAEQSESIREKQEQLQQIFEESLSEEMQQLMEDIQELLEEMERDEALDKMEEMEMTDEQAEAELERMLELYKQLELEQEMEETIDKLEELAERQNELAEDTEQGEKSQEELQEEQAEIQEEFEEIQEKMEEMEEMNSELERPMQMPETSDMEESIEQDMEQSQEQMEQQNNEGASESQKSAGEKMKSMSESMSAAMMGQQMEGMQEDMEAIRQLLENIVDLSFDQERLIDDFGKATVNTPRYVELVQEQFQLENDFGLVRDSLLALANRNFNIESFITEKVADIRTNLDKSIDELEERRKPQAAANQQRAMTGLNDLALMLSESMQNMQQQMAGMMSGNQQCQNPGSGQGGGKPGENPGKGSQGQQNLNGAMERMRQQMESGEGGSSKEFAEMAARQAALRRALEQAQKEGRERGEGMNGELQELIDQMDQTEEDLVNKRLTEEMMMRQQDILNRMLDYEKAERQQDMDEKRQSETAEQRQRELPPELQEYIRQREAEVDMFKRVNPRLNPYFQGLVDQYFQALRGASE